jgi:spermidine synthase
MGPWLAHAQINRDQNLRLQYLAGFASSNRTEGEIYREMLQYRRFPEGLIVGSKARLSKLRSSLQPPLSPEDQEWLDAQLMLF